MSLRSSSEGNRVKTLRNNSSAMALLSFNFEARFDQIARQRNDQPAYQCVVLQEQSLIQGRQKPFFRLAGLALKSRTNPCTCPASLASS